MFAAANCIWQIARIKTPRDAQRTIIAARSDHGGQKLRLPRPAER
jgi:hypothetical protein